MENSEKILGFEIFTIHTTPLLNYCVYDVDLHITIKELPLFHYPFLVNEVLAHILLSSKMDIFSLFFHASFMYLIPEGDSGDRVRDHSKTMGGNVFCLYSILVYNGVTTWSASSITIGALTYPFPLWY